MRSAKKGDAEMALVDPMKAYDEIARWERVWIEVVALAWKDPVFRKSLLAHGGKDARAVINKKFNFELPKDVELKVVQAGPKLKSWDANKEHPRALTVLTLVLPRAPAAPEDHAIALSRYVASGHSMPFTCCC
jgi:ribosomally synthesized peptide (two-chain TOMM family)